MAFSALGSLATPSTATGDPIVLTLSSNVSAGSLLLVVIGSDSSSITISGISDSQSNTWDFAESGSSGSGMAGIGWVRTTSSMASGVDTVSVNFSGSANAIVALYGFTGLRDVEDVDGSKAYTESDPQTIALTATAAGYMFAVFAYPFDFGITANASGWTNFANIDDGTAQALLAFYKSVSAGSNTCSQDPTTSALAYYAAAVVLPLSVDGAPQVVWF